MVHPELSRSKEKMIENVSAEVQSNFVSRSHGKTSPTASVRASSRKKGSKRDRLRALAHEDDDIPIFISKTPKKSSIIAEIVLTSDEDSPKSHKIEENSVNELKRDLKKARLDLENADLDAPKVYAVWSKAGPPGPPISDSEDEAFHDKSKLSKFVKMEPEDSEPEDRRKSLRNMKYFDWDSSSSEDSFKKRGRRGKGKKKSYGCDPVFKTSKLRNKTHAIDETDEELTNAHERSTPNNAKSKAIQTVEPQFIRRTQYLKNIALSSKESNSSTSSGTPSTYQKSDSTKQNGDCSTSASQAKPSTSSAAPSISQKDNNAKQNGYCSVSGSQGSQSQTQSYRTGDYHVEELIEMINFLIDNHRISSCCSIHTWQLMARDKSQRLPQSLFNQFKETIAPNIGQFLKTMGRIGEPRLLEKFRKALQQAQIHENPSSALLSPSSVSLARTISSSSGDSSKVAVSGSTKHQNSVASKESKTSTSSGSRKSLDGTIISDSEGETETEDTRLIKVPPLFNGATANKQPVVKDSSQSEIKKPVPIISDIVIKKELRKSADAVSIPIIVVKTEPEEDEDDVFFIEAVLWSDETELVEVKLLIETSDESDAETVILPPPINRRNDEINCQKRWVKEENCPRVKQEKHTSPSVPTNIGTQGERREEDHSGVPRAEISSRIKREVKNKSPTLIPEKTPLQMDSSRRINNVKEEKRIDAQSTNSPIIADSKNFLSPSAPKIPDPSTNAFNVKELIIEEDLPPAPVNYEPRLSQLDKKLNLECRVLVENMIVEDPKPSTTPKEKGNSMPEGSPSLLRFGFRKTLLKSPKTSNTIEIEESPVKSVRSVKSPRRFPKIRVIKEAALSRLNGDPVPSTSAGLQGHGFQASEYHHLSRQYDSDSDSDSGFIKTKRPPNVPLTVNKCVPSDEDQVASTDPDDEETQFPPVRETRSKATMRKNSGKNVKNSKKESNVAAESAVHSKPSVAKKKRTKADDTDHNCSNPMKPPKKQSQETNNDDDVDANSESSPIVRKSKKAQPVDSDEVDGPTDLEDKESQFPPVRETRSKFFSRRENSERIVESTRKGARAVHVNSESPILMKNQTKKRKDADSDDGDGNSHNPKRRVEEEKKESDSDDEIQILGERRPRENPVQHKRPMANVQKDMKRADETADNSKYSVSMRKGAKKRVKAEDNDVGDDNSRSRRMKRRRRIVSDDDDERSDDSSSCRSRRIWERMYGPITVGRRTCGRRIEFDRNFHMEREGTPPDSDFSQELLDALYRDRARARTAKDKAFFIDLAVLHYFICRPSNIKNCLGKNAFNNISRQNWKILKDKTFNAIQKKFKNYIIGYFPEFGLPEAIYNEFLFWEWQRYLGNSSAIKRLKANDEHLGRKRTVNTGREETNSDNDSDDANSESSESMRETIKAQISDSSEEIDFTHSDDDSTESPIVKKTRGIGLPKAIIDELLYHK